MTSIVVMGVSASGKTEVGRRLATALDVGFVDGDDLHPPTNVAKMTSGVPLTDTDREPWLDAVAAVLTGGGVVVACSALRRSYRDRLRAGAGREIRVLHLDVSEPELRRRIERRVDHFMPPSLLADQLATLEDPRGEPDVTVIDADRGLDHVVDDALASLR